MAGAEADAPSDEAAQRRDAGSVSDSVAAPGAGVRPLSGCLAWLAVAAVLLAVDQGVKQLVQKRIERNARVAVLAGFFDLTLRYNKGAAFGMLASRSGWQQWFFLAMAVMASAGFLWLLRRSGGKHIVGGALALLLGGAAGNFLDRLLYGHVVDYLLFYWEDWQYPAFNVADAAITIGVVLLVIEILRDEEFFLGKSKDTKAE
eukprot:TRINITY_DN3359_c0_g1_i2.p1 TRINITY_DN3359_c0_g1~~TRINITY_DN3359_c0_g1_i2.p1  ORF type:complete len:220 (+),score=55.96 TRINITY_DN3359_c0_g1_i2:53-661(+)